MDTSLRRLLNVKTWLYRALKAFQPNTGELLNICVMLCEVTKTNIKSFRVNLPKTGNELGKKVEKVLNPPDLNADKSFDEMNFQQSQIPQSTPTQQPSGSGTQRRDRKRKNEDKKDKKKSKKAKRPIRVSSDSFSSSESERSSFTSDSYDSR